MMADQSKSPPLTGPAESLWGELRILCGNANPRLARAICRHLTEAFRSECDLGIQLTEAAVRRFPDGEIDVKIREDVRGTDVFIVQPTCTTTVDETVASPRTWGGQPARQTVNDMLMELLLLIDSARRSSATRITAVMPYYGYARKDRKDEGRVPIAAKLAANMLVAAGVDRVLTMDLHAPQIQGFFDIPVDHLYARKVLLDAVRKLGIENLVCASPDIGSMKMAIGFAAVLQCGVASCHKQRKGPEEVEINAVVGDVKGCNVLLLDDLIASGSSLAKAAQVLKQAGALEVYAAATHAVMCGSALETLGKSEIRRLFVTDTIPPLAGLPANVEVVSVARLLAQAIRRIHMNLSVSHLFHDEDTDGSGNC
jgi:ribose-phosphate pyrophosphokinase